jgi:two-component system sensor histidine kinase YesM
MTGFKGHTVRLILLLFLGLMVIPTFLCVGYLLQSNVAATYREIEYTTKTVLDELDLLVEAQVGQMEEYVRTLYGQTMLEIRSYERYRYDRYSDIVRRNEIERYLGMIVNQSDYVTGMYVLTPNENLFYSANLPMNPAHRELYPFLLDTVSGSHGEMVVIGRHRPWLAPDNNAPEVFSVCKALYQMDGTLAAVVILDMDVQVFVPIVERLTQDSISTFFLFDEQQELLASSTLLEPAAKLSAADLLANALPADTFQAVSTKVGDARLLCVASSVPGWKFVSLTLDSDISTTLLPIRIARGVLILSLVLCGVLFIIIVNLRVVRPMRQLRQGMLAVDEGNLDIQITRYRKDEFGQIIDVFNAMTERLNQQVKERCEHAIVKRELEYQELKGRINPHFILNSMQLISSNAILREDLETEAMVSDLSLMLRYALYDDEKFVALERELRHIELYVSFQQKASEETVELSLPSDAGLLTFPVLKMLLQPIIENSFFHAFGTMDRSPSISIVGKIKKGRLLLVISDNGRGFDASTLASVKRRLKTRLPNAQKNIGLANVSNRLKTLYGTDAWLDIHSLEGRGTDVVIMIPGSVEA